MPKLPQETQLEGNWLIELEGTRIKLSAPLFFPSSKFDFLSMFGPSSMKTVASSGIIEHSRQDVVELKGLLPLRFSIN